MSSPTATNHPVIKELVMKSFRTILSVSLLGLATVLGGCTADATSGMAEDGVATQAETPAADPNVAPAAAHFRGHAGREDFLIRAALKNDDLALSAEQKSKLEALVAKPQRKEEGAEKGAREERPKQDRVAFANAIRSGQLPEHAAPTAEQKGKFEARRSEHVAKAAAKLQTLHDTLTPEQRTKLVAAIESHQGRKPNADGKQGEKPADGKRAHGGEGGFGKLLAGLELTDAQKAALKADRPAKPSQEQRDAMHAERKEKLESFASNAFDATAFVQPKARPEHAAKPNPMQKLLGVLDSAQREQLAQRIEQGPARRTTN